MKRLQTVMAEGTVSFSKVNTMHDVNCAEETREGNTQKDVR